MKKNFFIKLITLAIAVTTLNGCSFSTNKNNLELINDVHINEVALDESSLIEIPEEDIEEVNEKVTTKELSHKKLTTSIVSKIFSLITIDLISSGYEVYQTYNVDDPTEKGISYVDTSGCYKNVRSYPTSGLSSEVYYDCYFEAGFISYQVNKTVENYDATDRLFSIIGTNDKLYENHIYFMDSIRYYVGIIGHFVMNNQYIIYQLIGDVVCIYNYDLDPSNFSLDLGSIYNYDINEYMFIPLSSIPKYSSKIATSTSQINPTKVGQEIDNMLQDQNNKGYQEIHRYVLFLSIDTYNLLSGSLAQDNSVNGVALSEINSISYDPDSQYATMNPDGSISIVTIPPAEVEVYKKNWKDWMVDALIIGGGTLLAVVITVASAGSGSFVAGTIIGATFEYASQAIFQGVRYTDINWATVAVGAVFGALQGGIPVSSSLGQFTIHAFEAALLGGAESLAKDLINGEEDTKTILIHASINAIKSVAFYGARNILSNHATKPKPQVTKYEPKGDVKPIPKIDNIRATDFVDDVPTENLRKLLFNEGAGNVINESVSTVTKNVSGTFVQEFGEECIDKVKDKLTEKVGNTFIKKAAEEIDEFVMGMY